MGLCHSSYGIIDVRSYLPTPKVGISTPERDLYDLIDSFTRCFKDQNYTKNINLSISFFSNFNHIVSKNINNTNFIRRVSVSNLKHILYEYSLFCTFNIDDMSIKIGNKTVYYEIIKPLYELICTCLKNKIIFERLNNSELKQFNEFVEKYTQTEQISKAFKKERSEIFKKYNTTIGNK